MDYDSQVAALAPDARQPVQMERVGGGSQGTDQIQARANEGLSGSSGALPFADRIQESFGTHDISGVRAHTGPEAQGATRSMGANAYASGDQIAFSSAPSLFTAAHEAAHVVQQRAGVSLQGGVGVAGDAYEQHADAVAHAVVSGRSAQSLLDQGVGAAHSSSRGAPSLAGAAVQMEQANASSGPLTAEQVQGALTWCAGRDVPAEAWSQIAKVVGSSSTSLDATLVQKIAAWQQSRGLTADGLPGDVTMQWLSQEPQGDGLQGLIKNDKIAYLAFNPGSRGPEYNVIKGEVGAGGVAAATGRRQEDTALVNGQVVALDTDEGMDAFLGSLTPLSAAKRDEIRAFLQEIGGKGMDELAQFVRILHSAETGRSVIKRVIFSGHSGGWSIWGDDNGTMDFDHLTKLVQIFPNAMGQVEDLMLSACNTGQVKKLDQYVAIFPNLRSIWGYVGYSPSAWTGALGHIKTWTQVSEGVMDPEKMQGGREEIAAGTGKRDLNIALWTRDAGGNTDYQTASPYASRDYATVRSLVDSDMHHYTAAYSDGVISGSDLSRLYTNLQVMVGHGSHSADGGGTDFELVMKHVLYLRYWSKICEHFMHHRGALVQQAYEAANVQMPELATMSRSDFLAHFRSLSLDQSSEGFVLLESTLYALNPAQIPDNWV
ncbi:MAG: hypothetical protein CL940_12225 [Deltaproteobacteria bacterium]|nr:hypothetical protein [Deltaproteobacteria bacterium]